MTFASGVESVSRAVEVAGIAVLIAGALYSLASFAVGVVRQRGGSAYADLRRRLGGSILVGLEVLVGADIIRTVAVSPSFTSVGVLGLVVAVRTFLSFSLETELDGRWPWRRASVQEAGADATGQS